MKKCFMCDKQHSHKKYCSTECRNKGVSLIFKEKGISPPSRKGAKMSAESIKQIVATKKAFGWWHNKENAVKNIQLGRKLFYDKKGRKSCLHDLVKQTKKYKDWRSNVFLRDGHQCVFCKSKKQIQADHIIPKIIFYEQCNFDYEKCMEYPPLWDLSNGRTLCKKCHIATETHGTNRKSAKEKLGVL